MGYKNCGLDSQIVLCQVFDWVIDWEDGARGKTDVWGFMEEVLH